VREALDETGLPWAIVPGKKHHQIRLKGRLVGILPHGPLRAANARGVKNLVAHIRRAAKDLTEGDD
jgi:hypothetical protein